MIELLIGLIVILVVGGVFYLVIGHVKEYKQLIKENALNLSEKTSAVKSIEAKLKLASKELDELTEINLNLETETVEQNTKIKTLQGEVDRMGFEISDLEDEIKHYKASALNYESMSVYIEHLEKTINIMESEKVEKQK